MGQRTTIILKYEHKDAKYPHRSFTEVKVYYHQWGIGRGVPSQMMAILNNHICNRIYDKEGLKYLQPQGTLDETPDLLQDREYAAWLEQVGFDKPEIIGQIMLACGNNNGGVYMHIVRTWDEERDESFDIKYAFMIGDDREHFCTKEKWIEEEGMGYVDKKFRKLFEDTLKYWGARDVIATRKEDEV